MIHVQDLVKAYGPVRAVDGISFDVEPGQVVGFLGPNGAGKTTTIRVLTCYHPATSGVASIDGADVFSDSLAVRRKIGYLPENVPIYTDLRVEEYLHYRAALKGVPRKERQKAVESAMEDCGVTEVRRKLTGHVSRGYRQRVGLADALVARPPVLILDEPTSGLDPNQRMRMRTMVKGLAERHTVLFSSHILAEVEDVASRILVIHKGTIRAEGTPRDLMQQAEGRRIEVRARAAMDALQGALAGAGLNFEMQDLGDGMVAASAAVAPGQDPTASVAACLHRAAIEVHALQLIRPRLEDFFQQVTEGAEQAANLEAPAEVAP